MKVLVCIKRVPDTATKIKIAGDGRSILSEGVEFIISPFDEFAVEEAIRIKEKLGADVTILSVGENISKEIRTGLAMGADNGVQLKCSLDGADPLSIAKAIAGYAKDKGFDLILCGKSAVDDGSYQVAGMLAALLDYACVNTVVELGLDGGKARCRRDIEGGAEIVEASLPLVASCQKGLNNPRYTNIKGVMAAKRKVIEEIPVILAAAKVAVSKLDMPPARQACKILGKGPDAAAALVAALHNEAKVI